MGRRLKRMSERAAADTAEVIKEIRTVREFVNETQEANKYEVTSAYRSQIDTFAKAVNSFCFGWPLFIIFISNRMQAMYQAGHQVSTGQLSIGVALQFTVGVQIICDHLRISIEVIPRLVKVLDPLERVNELLQSKPRIEPQPTDAPKLTKVEGAIEFHNVDFSVPDKKILQGLSFRAEPGMKVAFVGHAGCGKSTSIRLLERFYNPTGGDITLNGLPLQDYCVHALRRHTSVVAQDNVLFSTTIRENITYGLSEEEKASPDIDARIEDACKKASIWNDIQDQFPRKLESFVGEKGFKLSGGQKQRIAIARAMIRNPKILLLDEATSALDSVNESVVQKALDEMMAMNKNGCTIMIAHRLSTIKNCDKIIVMSKGKKVEEGTHDELLQIPIVKQRVVASGNGHSKPCQKHKSCDREEKEDEEATKEITVSGFYRELWETQNGPSNKGGLNHDSRWIKHLEQRVRELETELKGEQVSKRRIVRLYGYDNQHGSFEDRKSLVLSDDSDFGALDSPPPQAPNLSKFVASSPQ